MGGACRRPRSLHNVYVGEQPVGTLLFSVLYGAHSHHLLKEILNHHEPHLKAGIDIRHLLGRTPILSRVPNDTVDLVHIDNGLVGTYISATQKCA